MLPVIFEIIKKNSLYSTNLSQIEKADKRKTVIINKGVLRFGR